MRNGYLTVTGRELHRANLVQGKPSNVIDIGHTDGATELRRCDRPSLVWDGLIGEREATALKITKI